MSADKILKDGPAPRVIEHSWTDIRDWIAEVFGDRNPSALAMLDLGIEAGLDRYLTAVLRERRSRRWSVTSSKGEAVYGFQLTRVKPG